MRVKKGDLAIVTRSSCGNEGKIGTVLLFRGVAMNLSGVIYNDWWIVEFASMVNSTCGVMGTVLAVRDAHLRPVSGIPDTEDTDIEQPINDQVPA